jgi:hypothetical protein
LANHYRLALAAQPEKRSTLVPFHLSAPSGHMNAADFAVRGKAAPRNYIVLGGGSGSLVTIHQFYVEGLFYGRIWAPRIEGANVACRASFGNSGTIGASGDSVSRSFVVPDSRSGGVVTFTVTFSETPPAPYPPNVPALILTAEQLAADGLSLPSSEDPRYITFYDLRCGGHIGLQVGHVAIEVERDYPWRGGLPFIGDDNYSFVDMV